MVPVPPIIDPAAWELAQRCLAENQARASRNTKRQYLLRGLIFCPCGRRWTAQYKAKVGRAYYVCPTSPAEPWQAACTTRFSIQQDPLEAAVWTQVADFFLHPDTLLAAAAQHRADQAARAERQGQRLATLERALADTDHKLGQLLTRELEGYPQAVIDREKQTLLAHRRELEAEQDRLLAAQAEQAMAASLETALWELAETVQVALPAMTFAEKRRLLELLRIRVDVLDRETVRVSGIITDAVVTLTRSR
jgi:site-specific DNA recombinase